ncbi:MULTISPECIES: DUF5779 family protein [unclassified Haladaptatus]|uniref:DUF5779 family protein n=1 Tax=unclassified Haladaptatus TaxID=2622732 RepID=UPI0023E8E9B6|nr:MULTISPECIES: DUF5779 family protein [unclassified Haladaptatus]
MGDFDLDLRAAESELEEEGQGTGEIVLGVLDGGTPPEEWVEAVREGKTLFLAIEGDLNQLAAGFARDVRELDGELMHFREFLIVTPPGVGINTDRL